MTNRSSRRTALLAGASGLVGGHLLQRLLADPRYKRVITVSRKALGIEHPKLYLRVKGETEEAVAALGYPVLHIFRPGLLLGHRAKPRPREALGMALAPFLNPLMLGPAKAYRGIPADMVAAAMIIAAGAERTGRHIHTYADMVAPEGG